MNTMNHMNAMNGYPPQHNIMADFQQQQQQQQQELQYTHQMQYPVQAPVSMPVPAGMAPHHINMLAHHPRLLTPSAPVSYSAHPHNISPYGSTSNYWSLGFEPPMRGHESKARFSPDEVKSLEQIFQENNKPSGEHKREIAERLNVEVARINNWFQNRRAKKKQEDKLRDKANAQAGSTDGPDGSNDDSHLSGSVQSPATATVHEVFPTTESTSATAPLRPSAATFPVDSSPAPATPVESSTPAVIPVDSVRQSELAQRRSIKVSPVRTSPGNSGAIPFQPGNKDFSRPRVAELSPGIMRTPGVSGRIQKRSISGHSVVSPTQMVSLAHKFSFPTTPVVSNSDNGIFTGLQNPLDTPASMVPIQNDMSPMAMSSYQVVSCPPSASNGVPMLSMSSGGSPGTLNMNMPQSGPVTPSPNMSGAGFITNMACESSMPFEFGYGNMMAEDYSPSGQYDPYFLGGTATQNIWSTTDPFGAADMGL